MVVKAVRGRRRYIVFQLGAPLGRSVLASGFRLYGKGGDLRVIQCLGKWVVIGWFGPEEVEEAISIMRRVDPLSKSLLISGTIASLRRRYPALQKSHLYVGVK